LKISADRPSSAQWGDSEFRSAETGCAERILARRNGVAEQTPALFRQFLSQAEAEKWIERHRWLTE
jgi:hypothetical protein